MSRNVFIVRTIPSLASSRSHQGHSYLPGVGGVDPRELDLELRRLSMFEEEFVLLEKKENPPLFKFQNIYQYKYNI